MAKHVEPTLSQTMEWNEWLASKPENVRQMAIKYPPELLYRMKSTGKRVCIISYAEDGTVSVVVSHLYNLVAMDRMVFGIKPDEELVECDLPGPDEKVGLTGDPLKGIIDEMMAKVSANMPTKHQRMVFNVSRN